jgi:dienelactone hydrolase
MFRDGKCAAFAVLTLLLACASAVRAQELTIETGLMDVTVHGSAAKLDTIVIKRADLTGRLPVAMITHGVSRSAPERAALTTNTFRSQAIDMALRGYLAVGVIRRNFGQSTAATPPPGGCASTRPGFLPEFRNAAAEVEAARRVVVQRPDADPTKIVGLGVSVGGGTMLAWAAEKPEGLVAIVNVSGGSGSAAANSHCDEPALISAFGTFGSTATVPTIWFYAANDTFFGPAMVERMHAAYTGRGGKAERHAFDAIGTDGHFIWSLNDGRQRWLPLMDKFLVANGLPTYDPEPARRVAANLNDAAKAALERYLEAPAAKLFMVSANKGAPSMWRGANEIELARKSGLENCEKTHGEPCRIVLENFRPTER